MTYICVVKHVQTERNMIRLAWKTWSIVNTPSPIMADGTVTSAFISVTPSADTERALKVVII